MDIHALIANGESSYVEFKEQIENAVSFAEEIVALLNFQGGSIFLGISDAGEIIGVSSDTTSLEERLMNICRENIIPPVIPAVETIKLEGNTLVKITLNEGLEKPYRTKQGKYLIRVGSTKRQTSREELARLFQNALICHNDDRGVSGATSDVLDLEKVRQYFSTIHEFDLAELSAEAQQHLLINASC